MANLRQFSQQYLDTAHLLRRAGFGSRPEDIELAANAGIPATTETLLNYEQTPDNVDDDAIVEKMEQILPENVRVITFGQLPVQVARLWWVYRMLASPRQLQEKMVLFWHNHFTSSDDGLHGELLVRQNQLFRTHALGNFRTLALEVSRDPEMLRYLNGNQNYKAHPNENYARELMELFTCGRVDQNGKPNYTEYDVKAGARAFSGWNLRQDDFYFNPNQHDDTVKTFMGHTGDLNGDDIVDMLVALPATGYYICRKLFRYFAYDDPEPVVLDAIVKTYFNSGYDIRAVVGQILLSNAFYSEKARNAIIKSPAQYVIGTVRMAGLSAAFAPPLNQIDDNEDMYMPGGQQQKPVYRNSQPVRRGMSPLGRLSFLANAMRNMDQNLMAPPSVKGWDGGELWINTNTLQERERFANTISAFPAAFLAARAVRSQISAFTGIAQRYNTLNGNFTMTSPDVADPASMVDGLLGQFGPLLVSDSVRQTLVEYAASENRPYPRLQGTLALLLATPDYQVC